ncbi:hypothetical protein [Clostridium sp. CCUG 7971]|uniref:hypothetical protein n=1 Tax=Clostridium sp. CCUG 7971 TaxID=2811414 RepID=UPI001ABB6BB5|nr:hypothetical protein [Clostridium sp. CCUG 7971]MBO3443533.1 hypothetical protein [Clostridium sp. CCUG 7971]
MKRILLLGLFILFIFNISGCTPQHKKTEEPTTQPNKIDENIDKQKSPMSKAEYKENLVKSYEKYIKPLDLKNYDDLEDIVAKKGEINHEKFLNDLEESLNDSKINIKAFEESIIGLEIDDDKLKKLNDKLVEECKVLMDDIKVKETAIAKIDENILKKPTKELIQYLKTNLDDDITEKINLMKL